jgi:hypothetical protein
MILRYRQLKCYPAAFMKVTGLELSQFERLLSEILPYYVEAEHQRRCRPDRQRAIGGGDRSNLEVCDQVLLALIWLWLYPKQQVLAAFFGISQPTVWRYIQRIVPLLRQTGQHVPSVRDPGRKRRRNLAGLLTEVPELVTMIDELVRWASRTSRSPSR